MGETGCLIWVDVSQLAHDKVVQQAKEKTSVIRQQLTS